MSVLNSATFHLVDSWDSAQRFMAWLGQDRRLLAVDIETTGLSLARDRIRLVQFGDTRAGWAIPWEGTGAWRGLIKEVLQEYSDPIVGHHLKFDAGHLQKNGVPIRWDRAHDTMNMCFLADSLGPKGLKPASALHIDPRARTAERLLKNAMQKGGWDYATIPIEHPLYWGYAAADVVLTAALAEILWPRVQYAREAYDLEMDCARILCEMEVRGVRIDVPYIEQRCRELRARLESLLTELEPLNPFAPEQVAKALQGFGVELKKRTKAGKLSVDKEVLATIDHPLARKVKEARDVQKTLASFYENFLEYRDDDVIHPHFNQIEARTGRMSTSEPSLQNIPRGPHVRDSFIPRDGNWLLLVDYSNQEARLAAHYSRDPGMLAAFHENRDLHSETARRVFGVDEPSSKQRNVGKTATFAKIYGAGPEKFAKSVGLPFDEGAAIFNAIDRAYPGLNRLMANVTQAVRERAKADGRDSGYVELVDGRRLRVPVDRPYIGTNYLIQGTGAYVLKRAISDLDAAGFGSYLNLLVHDEIHFDIPESVAHDAAPEIRKAMERHDFDPALTVDGKFVRRWGDPYREEK